MSGRGGSAGNGIEGSLVVVCLTEMRRRYQEWLRKTTPTCHPAQFRISDVLGFTEMGS
jgi:hypothetical protein